MQATAARLRDLILAAEPDALLGSLTEVVLDFIGRASGKPLEDAEIGRRTLVGHLRSRNVSAALAESRKLAESVHRFLR